MASLNLPRTTQKALASRNVAIQNHARKGVVRGLPAIEKKWRKRWEKAHLFKVKDKEKGKKNFYHLVMFPYPSGNLHIGHWYNFAPADTYARFKRMQGFNVLSPIGFDAFGLPAENAALKHNIHPREWTFQNIETMREQLKSIGPMYDWSREVVTCDPQYYVWTQWIFLQMFKKGLAKRQKTWANWCPSCKTVLANEQVIAGLCERCESEVIQRQIDQWVFAITKYAQRLLDDLEGLDWPARTKTMQRNWIGRSEGATIEFRIQNLESSVKVFTTRPDTIFGATYLVLAPEHDIIKNLELRVHNLEDVKDYIKKSLKKTPLQRQTDQKQKTGVELKGIKAINPATEKEIPVWVADYVLAEYGTGAIMAVPAHDERDFVFAKQFELPIVPVINPTLLSGEPPPGRALLEVRIKTECYIGEGVMINSDEFNGMPSEKAREEIVMWLKKKGFAERAVQYKLRDWIVSRQRYWGCPIPIVHCPRCGQLPVPEKNLPVLLPDIEDFKPTGTGESPLATSKDFVEVACPRCGGSAKRETDTMDTFVDSSWYFLRYTDPKNNKQFANKNSMRAWLPVDIYIGGAEHTVLHLLYSRFLTKVLYDLGCLSFQEPFTKLRHQGIILGPDGQKMSKSRGNVVAPDPLVKKYGADVVRMYLEFLGPYDQGGAWNPGGIQGIVRFLEKVQRITIRNSKSQKMEKLLHKTIKKVREDLEELRFNTAISALMVLVNEMAKNLFTKDAYERVVKLLAPFAPHLAEELWFKLGHKTSVHQEIYPTYDNKLIEESMATLIIQVNGKVRGKLEIPTGISEKEAIEQALNDKGVSKWISDKQIKKTVFVPDRLINFVL